MKIYFLDYGWLEGDCNWMVALTTYATKSRKEIMPVWGKFPEYGVLVEQNGEYILYDTGSNMADYDKSERFPFYCAESQGIINQLRQLGLCPTDIGTVVLSHAHDDHVGNTDLFPHAQIYIDREEYEFVQKHPELMAYERFKNLRRINLIDNDREIETDIVLKRLPGHSPGLLGMYLTSGNSDWLFVSDAINTQKNFSIPPKAAVGLYDEKSYFETIDKIRKLEKEKNVQIFYGHDKEQFDSLKKCPEYYEL